MKYSDYIVQGNRVSYHGIPVIVDEILNKSHDYSPDKEELNRFPSLCHVGIIYDDWKTDIVIATALRPLTRIADARFFNPLIFFAFNFLL